MTPAERRARFADAARREADRGEREQPLVPGSDAAYRLTELFGDSVICTVRERLAREAEEAEKKAGEHEAA